MEAGFHLNQIWRHLFLQGSRSGKPCPVQTVCLALALDDGHKAKSVEMLFYSKDDSKDK